MLKSLVTALLVISSSANAASLTGDLSGQFNFNGNVNAGATSFDFLPGGQGTGVFNMQFFGNTGTWSALNGSAGTIQDTFLQSPSFPTGLPIGQTVSQANWLTFSLAPNVSFTLTKILPGIFSNAACESAPTSGQTCTPTLLGTNLPSATNFVNNSGRNSSATFNIEGLVVNSLTNETFRSEGQFVANFQGQYYQDVLNTIASNGFVPASYTAQFNVTAVPEPDNTIGVLILGLGLATVVGAKTKKA
jgi:hypothetical protein